jgi:sec-independent protein translocase protein TatA
MLVILFLALMIFGAKRLPEMGRSMGKSLREFKGAMQGLTDQAKSEEENGQVAQAGAEGSETPKRRLREGDASDE